MGPARMRTRRISSVAYATDESASDAKTASAIALPRRSCRDCAVGSGVPTKRRLSRCRRTAAILPLRGGLRPPFGAVTLCGEVVETRSGDAALLQLEGLVGVDAGCLQERSRAPPTVRHGFEAHRTARTAGGPAIDAGEMMKAVVDLASTAASRFHLALLRG